MRTRVRFTQRERNAFVLCVAFIGATLLLSLVDQNSIIHSARSIIDPNYLDVRYTGTIVTPSLSSGICRFVQYDNKTSEFRNTEFAECLRNSGRTSPYARMEALRDTFKK